MMHQVCQAEHGIDDDIAAYLHQRVCRFRVAAGITLLAPTGAGAKPALLKYSPTK